VQRNKVKAGSRLGRGFDFFADLGNSLQHGCDFARDRRHEKAIRCVAGHFVARLCSFLPE
jgi:hypothetical protein